MLTISPELLAELAASNASLPLALDLQAALSQDLTHLSYDEANFRFALNQDAMGTEKLAEGIRAFCVDAGKLDQILRAA